MIKFAMLRMMIGRIPTVERHPYRRARLRGRARSAKQGRLAVLVPATLSAPGIAGVEAAAKVTHVLPCRDAGVSRY